MGVKRQNSFEVIGADRHLDQYVATYEHQVGLEREGVPGVVLDYCDATFPDDDWDWHFKIVGAVLDRHSLYNGNVETEGYLSFRFERHAFDFWWWYQQQEIL